LRTEFVSSLVYIQGKKTCGKTPYFSWQERGAEPVWFTHPVPYTHCIRQFFHLISTQENKMEQAFLAWVQLEQVGRGCHIFSREKIRWSTENSCSALEDVWQ
jgi:hypothetical protein